MIRLLRRLWRRLFARRGRCRCPGPVMTYYRWLYATVPGNPDVLAIFRRRPCGCVRVNYVLMTRRAAGVPLPSAN